MIFQNVYLYYKHTILVLSHEIIIVSNIITSSCGILLLAGRT